MGQSTRRLLAQRITGNYLFLTTVTICDCACLRHYRTSNASLERRCSMDSVEVDMNYEFFFLRNVGLENPTVLRVMAPSYHHAIALVARHHGCTSLAGNWKGMKEFCPFSSYSRCGGREYL